MRRRLTLFAVSCGALLAAALAAPQHASAHALAQSSVPAAGAVLNQSPKTVVITFGEAPDPRLSSIGVLDTSGAGWTSGPTTVVPGNADQLQVPLKPLPHGVYTVTWKTVSAVDGHLAAGSFAFGVGVAPTAAQNTGTVASPPPSLLAVFGRFLLFAGLMLVLGVASISLFVLPEPRRVRSALIAAGALGAVSGTFLVVDAQRSAAGISWGDVFASSLGTTLTERAVFAVLLLVAAAVVWLRTRRLLYRAALVAAAIAALGAIAVDVFASHAGAESPVLVNELTQWLHIVAAGVWIGGLGALLLSIRGRPSAEKTAAIRRFSFIAGISIAVVAASGVVRAVLEIGTFSALFGTSFGQLVIIKAALLIVLAGLGALNRYRHIPLTALSLRRLRVAGSTEMIVATTAILVAAALVNVSPPVAAQAQTAAVQRPLVVTGSDAATTVKLRLSVSPGTPGFNTFSLTLADYDTGKPVTPGVVKLSFTSIDEPTVGGSTLVLKRTSAGVFAGQGANLSLNGRWRIAILLEQGAASTEVDVQVTVSSPPPVVDVLRTPGEPTLYRVHLPDDNSVEFYLDPDKPGATHFHATFFDAAGNELPVTSATITVTEPGASPAPLVPMMLEPGHFVANVSLPAGKSHFTVSGSTASGLQLATAIDLTPGAH